MNRLLPGSGRKLRIAQLVSHQGKNGVATSTCALVGRLAAAGHDVLLVDRTGSWIGRQSYAPNVARLTSNFDTRYGELSRVRSALREWRADLIHCHGSRANKYGMAYRLLGGMPAVATAHNTHLQLPWMFFDAVIAPSRWTALRHRRRNLVSARRLHVVPNVVELGTIAPRDAARRAAARAALGISETSFVMGVVGALSWRKNQTEALRILKRVVQRNPDSRLVLVGDPPASYDELPGWSALAADPDVAPRLVLTGARDDAVALMAAFDVFLSTSREESGPVAPLEAMAVGLPLVCYAAGDLDVRVEDGVNGYLLPQGALEEAARRVLELAADPLRARHMGAASRRKIETDTSDDAMLARIEQVYRGVVGE